MRIDSERILMRPIFAFRSAQQNSEQMVSQLDDAMTELEKVWPVIREYDFYADFLLWKASMEEGAAVQASIAAELGRIRMLYLAVDSTTVC